MAMTVLDHNIVADLKAKAIAVVIARSHVSHRVAITVLQENIAAIIAVKVFTVLQIAIKRNVFNQHIRGVLTCLKRENSRSRRFPYQP